MLCLPAMKTTMTVLLALALLAGTGLIGFYVGVARGRKQFATLADGSAPASVSVAPTTGKFQIVPGEYTSFNNSAGVPTITRSIFRIDTETGKTFLFREIVVEGKLRVYWDEIDQQ
jgi:hypothetical protein